MAAKQQHSDGKRWCEEQPEIPADRGRDTHVVQPTSQNREWQYEDLEKIQTCPPPHSAGEGKKRLQPHGREDDGDQDHRKRQKPFNPILKDELVRGLEHLKRGIMPDLIDNFRCRVQQEKKEEKDCVR